MNTPYIALTV